MKVFYSTMAMASLLSMVGTALAYAQVPPNLGQPNGAAALNGSGVVPSAQIPFGTTTGTVGDGAVLATTSTNATNALSTANTANTTANTANTTANAALPAAGGTMTGNLTLSGAPTANLHPATKLYTDTAIANVAGSANSAQLTANNALPKAGGTVTGALVTSNVQADASKVRLTATGTTYTVPATTSWLAMVQTGTIAAQTLTLPASPVDGQRLRVSTIGQVTALTLSPTVAGWANGATLPPNSGFEVDWDATSSSWLRVQ